MEEYLDLINNCDACIQKTYTTGCFNCEVYKVKTVIGQLQNEIIKLKADNKNLSDYCCFIDNKYFNIIADMVDFNQIKIYKRDLNYLLPEENIIAILYNKSYKTII